MTSLVVRLVLFAAWTIGFGITMTWLDLSGWATNIMAVLYLVGFTVIWWKVPGIRRDWSNEGRDGTA